LRGVIRAPRSRHDRIPKAQQLRVRPGRVFAVKMVLRAPGTVARLPRAIARYRAA